MCETYKRQAYCPQCRHLKKWPPPQYYKITNGGGKVPPAWPNATMRDRSFSRAELTVWS